MDEEIPGMLSRRNFTLTLYGDYLVIFGGTYIGGKKGLLRGSSSLYPDDIAIVNLKTQKLQNAQIKGNSLPTPRHSHTACFYGRNKIIIYGGTREPNQNQTIHLNEVGILSLDEIDANSVEWEVVKDTGSLGRAYHTSQIYEDNMYIFGGSGGENNLVTNDLLRLDLATYEVIVCKTSGEAPRARGGHCGVIYKDKYYIFGGFLLNVGYMNDLYFIDLTTFKWEKVSSVSDFWPKPRSAIDAQLINSKIYIFGGCSGFLNALRDLIVYDIENNKWESIDVGSADGTKLAYHNDYLLMVDHNSPSILRIHIKRDNTKITAQQLPGLDLSQNRKTNVSKGIEGDYVRYLKQLFLNPLFSDITFVIQNQELFAHKNILAARCKFFGNMFSSGMAEAHSSKIHISDMSLKSFKALLEFIYCNDFQADEDLALDLIELSDRYSFSELKHACEEFLAQKLTLDNFEKMANIAEKLEASLLRNSVKEFIIKNIDQIQQKKDVGSLPTNLLLEAIQKLASIKP